MKLIYKQRTNPEVWHFSLTCSPRAPLGSTHRGIPLSQGDQKTIPQSCNETTDPVSKIMIRKVDITTTVLVPPRGFQPLESCFNLGYSRWVSNIKPVKACNIHKCLCMYAHTHLHTCTCNNMASCTPLIATCLSFCVFFIMQIYTNNAQGFSVLKKQTLLTNIQLNRCKKQPFFSVP